MDNSEADRCFEHAVPRTVRSVISWCQPNRQGIAKLDSYFDLNERTKAGCYFLGITTQSPVVRTVTSAFISVGCAALGVRSAVTSCRPGERDARIRPDQSPGDATLDVVEKFEPIFQRRIFHRHPLVKTRRAHKKKPAPARVLREDLQLAIFSAPHPTDFAFHVLLKFKVPSSMFKVEKRFHCARL